MIIPDDIRTKALKLARLAIFHGGVDWAVNDISEALLEERERAAKIAERLNGWGADNGRGGHAMHIAKIIREE